MEPPTVHALCYRCEYRAIWHETKQGPRAQCHDGLAGVGSCYMYKPVLPYVTVKDSTDKRPRFAGAMISSRERVVRAVEKDDMILRGRELNDTEVFLYWVPKRRKEGKANVKKEGKQSRGKVVRSKGGN